MLFQYILDSMPLMLAFATPQMPISSPGPSPSASAEAERRRMAASDAAIKAASEGGSASTRVAGLSEAYAEQQQNARAGGDLIAAGSTGGGRARRDMGMD